MSSEQSQPIVTISYADLVGHKQRQQQQRQQQSNASASPKSDPGGSLALLDKIGEAFGSDSSLGILLITSVPNFPSLRASLLPLAHKLATLPPNELSKLEAPEAGYQVGWSHGRERVQGDKFDTSKGSFYANPLVDDLLGAVLERRRRRVADSDNAGAEEEDAGFKSGVESPNGTPTEEELRRAAKDHPAFFAPNVWPSSSSATAASDSESSNLTELEGRFKEMGRLICSVGRLVAALCDSYVSSKCPGYAEGKLESTLSESLMCKGRLLHYFPAVSDVDRPASASAGGDGDGGDSGGRSDGGGEEDTDFSDWCGWHNDHGSLTGLVPAMYLDKDGNEVPCPDPKAGLYIKSRNGRLVRARLPPDSLAFQVGETSQIHTGGVLQATPHAVRGCGREKGSGGGSSDGVSRETFAVFMEPEFHGDMRIPEGRTAEDTQRREVERYLPRTVRTLRSRWEEGMNFGEFSDATFAAFH